MIQTIIGAILLLLPLGLAVFRRDKKKEIIFLLLVCFLFQTGLSLAVQSVKIFYYPVVLVANILFILVLFSIYFFKDKKIYFGIRNIDLALIFVILVSFACLYQVHFRYSGEITLATDQIPAQYHKVSSMVYPYPYYSDEWYSVSFIKNAINTHSLPLGPSILRVRPFINLEVFFHSFLSGIFLLLKTDPLTSYQIVSIFFNILLICLSYLFLRLNGIKKSISAISSLFILYIACGASLPGIWHLLPVSFGVIFLLLALCFFSQKEAIFALSALILACFCYPPFIFIYAILFVLFLCFEVYHDYIRKRAKEIISIMFGLIPLLVFLVICFFIFAPAFLTSRIFFVAFSGFNQTNFYFQYMIPFPAIVLALAGLPHIYRKTKWLFWLFMFCLSLWTAYLFTFLRFFSEFERLIYLTSVLICMISGFGIKYALEFLDREIRIKNSVSPYFLIGALFLFIILIPFYTSRNDWKNLTYTSLEGRGTLYPKAPANNYLTSDDLNIFKDIKGKKFLSLPWKGTTIGVATDNYPVVTKEGTVSMGSNNTLDDFLKADCAGKEDIAKSHKLDYVYIYKFDCTDFEKIAESSENLALYKVKK